MKEIKDLKTVSNKELLQWDKQLSSAVKLMLSMIAINTKLEITDPSQYSEVIQDSMDGLKQIQEEKKRRGI